MFEPVWEWCKNVWYSNSQIITKLDFLFENDVKMYGIQTMISATRAKAQFENDVKMYGIQTFRLLHRL